MIERYVRSTYSAEGCTLEPGVEWREGDDFKRVAYELKRMASLVVHMRTDAMTVAMAFGDLIRDHFTGRYYFVEVFAADGSWSQEYMPCGSRPRTVRGKR